MLSRVDNQPPRTVHSLRSRIVFFMRDWSLTLYVAPFALARPSYWLLLILALGATADWQLRRAVDGLADRDPSHTRWEPLAYFRANLRLALVLLLISAALAGVFGPKAAIVVAGLWFAVWATLVIFDPASKTSIHAGLSQLPRYKDDQIQYPGLLIGPLHIFFVAEFSRVGGLLALSGGGSRWESLSFSAVVFCLVILMYWTGAFLVARNDEIRAERRI